MNGKQSNQWGQTIRKLHDVMGGGFASWRRLEISKHAAFLFAELISCLILLFKAKEG